MYSDIVPVEIIANLEAAVFSNPNEEHFQTRMERNYPYELGIYTNYREFIQLPQINLIDGVRFDCSELDQGVYMVGITQGKTHQNAKAGNSIAQHS